MIFYIVLFILSAIGSLYLILRHKNELVERYETFSMEHPANFAHFMHDIAVEFHGLWDAHMREQILLFVEKRLRWFRIGVLKVEHFLFRATHRVRDASNRNNTSTNDTQDVNIEDSSEIK